MLRISADGHRSRTGDHQLPNVRVQLIAGRRWCAALRLLVLVAAGLLLSGCLQAKSTLQVFADDTVNGQLTVYFATSLLTGNGRTPAEGFADYRQSIPPLPPGDEQVYDDGTNYGTNITYDHVPLAAFGGNFSITHTGNSYTFGLDLDPANLADAVAGGNVTSTAALIKLAALQFTVTLPGTIESTNGTEVTSDTVTWDLPTNTEKPTSLTATSVVADTSTSSTPTTSAPGVPASTDGGGSLWLWLLIGAGVVIVGLVVVLVIVLRSRGRSAAPGGATPGSATPPGAPPTSSPST